MHSRGILLLVSLCCTIITADQHFVNVATNKNYSQISEFHHRGAARNAADGDTGGSHEADTCSHTNSTSGGVGIPRNVYHWWQVDLGKIYPVRDITVWARKEQNSAIFFDRLYPFMIEVDSKICVRVASAPTTRSYSVTCSSVMYGQVVRLTLTKVNTPLNLCEFQIFVCKEGFYGLDCSSPCDKNCDEGCNMTSGFCTRCKEGFWGPELCHQTCSTHCAGPTCQRDNGNCEVCQEGFYRPNCSSACHKNCEGGCNKITGHCTRCKAGFHGPHLCRGICPTKCAGGTCQRNSGDCNGCTSGFFGSKCICHATCEGGCDDTNGDCTDCKIGFWGINLCQQSCPANCAGNTCRRVDGRCDVCAQGYYRNGLGCQQCRSSCKGRQCDRENGKCNACPARWYGQFCNMPCNSGCGQCDQDTGSCIVCADNLIFPECTDCVDGYYGSAPPCIQCPGTCDNDTPCNKTTGHCDVCPPGKKGDSCNEECDGGQYGPSRCSLSCGQCEDGHQCHPVTGHCARCQPGFYPPLCNETCENKTYGENCSESCGQCKGGQPCNTTTGVCTTGCEPGYTGELCNTTCEEGLYGERCNKTCSNCLVNTTCHHQHGQCLVGCAPGFSGNMCDTEREEPYNSALLVGVIVGVLVVVVFAAVLIVVIRRRRSTRKHDSTKGDATGMQSSRVSTISSNENALTSQNDPSQSSDHADRSSGNSEANVYAVAIPKSKRPRDVIYENVTVPAKLSQELNSATSSTTVEQNGTKKTNTTNKRESKPPIAPKPTQGRLSSAVTETPPDPLPDDEEEDFKVSDAIYANEDLYANIKPTGIRVDKLQQTVVNKLRDGSLEEEFVRMIPRKDFTLKNGERKENYYKNRYNSILPYDKNRVELEQVDGDDASDYVNASFVRGYRIEKAYIAAQGPRDNTVDDFWRMVWQEGVTDIVMLTNVKEGNKPKCYEYWPAQGDRLTTGHMEVTGVEEETRAHFVIRTFDLKQTEGSEKRRVKQYHYQSWMDHEVPATTPLVNFWRYVRSRAPRTAQAPPLVVHCSAGVGRTGTFIALDIVIDHAQQEAEVNIYNTVDRLRDDRCHMVQNKGQYAFLHEAVVEAYMSGYSRIQMSDMDTVLPHTVTHHTPSDRIDTEFETLCKMRDCLTSPSYTTAKLKENRAKNRNPNALPNDKHLVYLTKHVKGRNQYINAVYMATFLQQRGSIMTQLPLPDTLVDMWRLVDGCDVNTIVSIGDIQKKKNMCCYWPKKIESPIHTGPYTISLQSVTKLEDTLHSYTLQMKTDDTSREVRVLHYAGWTGQVADNMADLIHLLTSLHTSHKDKGGKPVIVQCIDGASQSGVVCALWDVISRMTCDAELDVYMAVRQLHTVRPEALTSVEQYRFCYALAQTFKNSQNVYANM